MKQIAIILAFLVFSSNAFTQNEKKLSNWYLNANAGGTLFWGDLSDDVANPFSKYFTNQQGYSGGLTLSRNLFNFLDVNTQFTMGTLQGNRTKWSNNFDADFSFKTSYQELNINVGINLIKLFPAFDNFELFYPYLKGGVGYTFFNGIEKNQGITFSKTTGNTMIFVWGGGLKVPINKHFSTFFETSFHHANSDLLDSHDGLGTNVNDIYTYTSLGVIYRFNAKPKKAKLDIIKEEPMDTMIANNTVIENSLENQRVDINVMIKPEIIHQNDTFLVQIRINKNILNEKARIQQTLPFGMTAVNIQSGNGDFSFTDQVVSYNWSSFDETKPYYLIEYKVVSHNLEVKNHLLSGIMFYDKKGVEQIEQFKEYIEVKADEKISTLVASEEKKPEEKLKFESKITNEQTNVNEPIAKGIEFRVQIKAVYGQKTSIDEIAKELNLEVKITEEQQAPYYKYYAGRFTSYEEAKKLKTLLRNGKVPGAFIVAFKDGKRLENIQEAFSNEIQNNTNTSSATKSAEDTIYKIQLLASAKKHPVNSLQKQIHSVSDEKIIETLHNNMYKYVIGNYNKKEDALKVLSEIRKQIPDAFIVKFKGNSRI